MTIQQYGNQIDTLQKVCDMRIKKQENELSKLKHKEKNLLSDLNEKQEFVNKVVGEKNEFKSSYFQGLVGKSFAANEMRYFESKKQILEAKVYDAQSQKEKVVKSIEEVRGEIVKHKQELKKHTFKNEKFEYLKVAFMNDGAAAA